MREEQSGKRRYWWLAGLLALVWPGAGHIYAGRPKLGVALVSGFYLVSTLCILAISLWCEELFLPLAFWAGAAVLFYMAQLIWAIRTARRADRRLQGAPSGTKIAVVIYITMSVGFGVLLPAKLCVESFKMPSASMIPTILPGDCFLVDKLYDARRGDVVVYKRRIEGSYVTPARETVFIGRIVGLEGDSIELRDGDVYLNSRRLETTKLGASKFEPAPGPIPEGPHTLRFFKESYPGREHLIAHDDAYMEDRSAPLTVIPEGHFFILGDNRENANDSRFNGAFPVEKIVGRVSDIYWPSSLEGGVDWSRIGEPVN